MTKVHADVTAVEKSSQGIPEVEKQADDVEPWLPKRYVILFLVGLGMLVIHAMRINVGLTVVALVDPDHETDPLSDGNEVSVRYLTVHVPYSLVYMPLHVELS